MSSYIWPFLICSVASTSTGMTDSVGFNCHIMDWSWAKYWLDNSSDITPAKTSNVYVKGCLENFCSLGVNIPLSFSYRASL